MKRAANCALAASLLGLMAAGLTVSHAQTDSLIVDQFDSDTTATFANLAWGTAIPSIIWNGAVNKVTPLGPDTPGSGSASWWIDWTATPGGADQVMVNYRFPDGAVLDLVNYTNISFDILFDPASATDGAGTFGRVEVDWTPQSAGWPSTSAGAQIIDTTNTDWVHVEIPFDASTSPSLSAVTHVGFKIQQQATGASLTGTTMFWMDNIILHGREAALPPPSVSIARVTTPPGLMVLAPGGGNGYRRGMIRTLDPLFTSPEYSWVGHGDAPVSYSLTIASYPAGFSSLQSEIFLVPDGGNDSSVDWNAPTVLALDIRDQADGTATAAFRYKLNHPSANADDYRPATLVCPSGVLGTWSMTFLNNTNVTVTAPNGASTNFALPPDVPPEFYDPLTVYFGNQQNGSGNAGNASTYSHASITGAFSPDIDEAFSGPDLNPDPANAKWQVVAEVPSSVFIVRPDHKLWVNWTLPDTDFTLQGSPSVAAGSWVTEEQWTNVIHTALGNRMLLPASSLPSEQRGFFRLLKPGS